MTTRIVIVKGKASCKYNTRKAISIRIRNHRRTSKDTLKIRELPYSKEYRCTPYLIREVKPHRCKWKYKNVVRITRLFSFRPLLTGQTVLPHHLEYLRDYFNLPEDNRGWISWVDNPFSD